MVSFFDENLNFMPIRSWREQCIARFYLILGFIRTCFVLSMLFSEVELNKQLNLGRSYECKRLCKRVLCYRLISDQNSLADVSGHIAECSADTAVSGYDHTLWTSK